MITKIGQTYYTDFYIGPPRKRIRIRQSLRTTNRLLALDKAQELKDRFEQQARQAKPVAVPLAEFCNRYLKYAEAEKPASLPAEKLRLEKSREYLEQEFGIQDLSELTPYHFAQLKAWLLKQPSGRGEDATLTKTTVNRYLQLWRGMFYRAQDWGLHPGPNPLRRIRFFKEQNRQEAYTPEEAAAIITAAEAISSNPRSPLGREFYGICLFALNAGLRRSEILKLNWNDVRAGWISVEGKGERNRRVPLNEKLKAFLRERKKGSGLIFDLPNSAQPGLFRRAGETIKRRTGISFGLHRLRHTFATKLIAEGVDIVTVAALLGHSRLTTTLIYAHTSPERMKEAVAVLDKKLVKRPVE